MLAAIIKLPLAALMLWIPFRDDAAMRAPEGTDSGEDDGGSRALPAGPLNPHPRGPLPHLPAAALTARRRPPLRPASAAASPRGAPCDARHRARRTRLRCGRRLGFRAALASVTAGSFAERPSAVGIGRGCDTAGVPRDHVSDPAEQDHHCHDRDRIGFWSLVVLPSVELVLPRGARRRGACSGVSASSCSELPPTGAPAAVRLGRGQARGSKGEQQHGPRQGASSGRRHTRHPAEDSALRARIHPRAHV